MTRSSNLILTLLVTTASLSSPVFSVTINTNAFINAKLTPPVVIKEYLPYKVSVIAKVGFITPKKETTFAQLKNLTKNDTQLGCINLTGNANEHFKFTLSSLDSTLVLKDHSSSTLELGSKKEIAYKIVPEANCSGVNSNNLSDVLTLSGNSSINLTLPKNTSSIAWKYSNNTFNELKFPANSQSGEYTGNINFDIDIITPTPITPTTPKP